MRATVKTALSALLMLLLAVSSANATTCLRVSDNEQFKLEFYKSFGKTVGGADELWLMGDTKTYTAKIIRQSSTKVVAAEVDMESSTVGHLNVTTYIFHRLKRRIQVFSSRLPQGIYINEAFPGAVKKIPPSLVAEFLCTKAQN